MDKFIVSARKYRPQNFSTVVGQSHITTTLKNAIKNNQLAHAFLFCGPRGVGKTTCARILAKTINCENRTPEGEACNTCNSCVSFDNGSSMNIHELDAASNNSVDDIRTLTEQIRFAPQAGKYKVYIVDEVHMLSASAFNAFLKTLEEPPPFAIFILATTEKHKILPTILSRCQVFDFKRITNQDTVIHLREICEKEHITAEKAALHIIAQKSEGCLRDSLSILDKIVSFTNGELTYQNTLEHLNILDEDYYFKLLDDMMRQDMPSAMLLFDEINAKGFEGDTVLEGYAEFIRNLLVSKDVKAAILLEVADDFKQKYLQAAQKVGAGWLIAALNLLNEANINYKQARNKRLHVELAIIKLSYLLQAVELVNDEGNISKKKQVDSTKAVAFRALPIIKLKETGNKKPATATNGQQVTDHAQLIIESPSSTKAVPGKPKQNVPAKSTESISPASSPAASTKDNSPAAHAALSSLKNIRDQLNRQNQGNAKTIKPLAEEELYLAWGAFIEKLVVMKKHSAVTNFKSATLKIADANTVEIITESNMQQKFIEQERASLIDHLQDYFCNRSLTYTVAVVEKEANQPAERSLSTKEQYLKMIEEYPLVKELKDRLKMELDY